MQLMIMRREIIARYKMKEKLSVVSGLIEEIKDLEDKINNSEVTVPHIVDQIKDKKDRLETGADK